MIENKKSEPFAKTQYFASTSANLIMIGTGCAIGWISLALPLLQSDKSPLTTGPLTVHELSWIGSVMSLGGLSGNIIFGFVVTMIGSRNCIFLIGLPQLTSWLFLMFGTCPLHLGISRFLSGVVVGGVQVSTLMYTAEIADNNIRGQLGTLFQYSRNVGVLLAYTLGSFYNYIVSSMFFSAVTILFFISFSFVPSTPQYLLHKTKTEAAEKAFKFYNKHRLHIDPKHCSIQFEGLKMVAKQAKTESKLTFKDIIDSRFGIIQAVIFSMLNCLSAQFIFLTYGSSITKKSGTHLSPQIASICMALVQLFATFVTFILIDKRGRKFLLILSLAGCTLSHGIMISYLHLYNNGINTSQFHWIPIVCMSSLIFSASIGIVPLNFICMVESFPVKTRSFGMTVGSVFLNMFSFIITKSFPILEQSFGLEMCLMVFCGSCALGILFAIVFVEETKGKELNDVDKTELPRSESFVNSQSA